jgi:hypothetical protein
MVKNVPDKIRIKIAARVWIHSSGLRICGFGSVRNIYGFGALLVCYSIYAYHNEQLGNLNKDRPVLHPKIQKNMQDRR